MEKVKEFLGNITKTGWIIISLVIAVILLVVIGFLLVRNGVDLWPFNNASDTEEIDEELALQILENLEQENESSEDVVLTAEDVYSGRYGNSVVDATQYVQNTQEVSIATFISSEDVSCGELAFVKARVPQRPAILNETLEFMFAGKVVTDFMPGNIVAADHAGLVFDNAILEDGLASIYLSGEFNSDEECSEEFALVQIEETAKQFDTVEEVEIYLNLEKVN